MREYVKAVATASRPNMPQRTIAPPNALALAAGLEGPAGPSRRGVGFTGRLLLALELVVGVGVAGLVGVTAGAVVTDDLRGRFRRLGLFAGRLRGLVCRLARLGRGLAALLRSRGRRLHRRGLLARRPGERRSAARKRGNGREAREQLGQSCTHVCPPSWSTSTCMTDGRRRRLDPGESSGSDQPLTFL